jgi:hypothetical protein
VRVAGERLERDAAWPVLAALGTLVALNAGSLGSEPWRFRNRGVEPHGVLAPLVRAAHRHWDLGFVRSLAVLAGVLVVAAAAVAWRQPLRRSVLIGLALAVVSLMLVPAVLLQVGLREATAPWQYVNDSTYQIELAGDLVLHGHDPYGHDYRDSELPRWYQDVRPQPPRPYVALDHLAYFPGTPLLAAAWRVLPRPLDDLRFLVLLATLASFFAVLLVRAPFVWRLAAAAVVAGNPLAVRAAWFGTADAPSLLALVLAFAFVTRSRYLAAAGALAAAVLLKQFALVALPFLAVMLIQRGATRRELARAGAVFAAVVLAGFLPFLVADPGAVWDDTIAYGGSTYRIVGYGLSSLLLRAGIVDDRFGAYPFVPLVLLVWLPFTAWLLRSQLRSRTRWSGAAGFACSSFVLFFISRVFQTSYFIWPLLGLTLAALFAVPERRGTSA